MRQLSILIMSCMLLFGLNSCARYGETTKVVSAGSGLMEINGRVESIDYRNRMASVRADNGRILSLRVPEKIGVFGLITVGDRVYSQYRESTVILVNPAMASSETYRRAMPNWQRLAVESSEMAPTIATVTDIDRTSRVVSLRANDGMVKYVNVAGSGTDLSQFKVGDQVLTYISGPTASVFEKSPSGVEY